MFTIKAQKSVFVICVIAFIAIIVSTVIFYEQHTRHSKQQILEYDADKLSYYLWVLDEESAEAYADIISNERGYRSLIIRQTNNEPFIYKVSVSTLSDTEKCLLTLGLIYEEEYSAMILHDDTAIGKIELQTTNRNIYVYFTTAIISFLFFSIIISIIHLFEAKAKHRQMDLKIHNQRQRLHAVVEAAPVITIYLDRHGTIRAIDGKGLNDINIEKDKVIGKSLLDAFSAKEALEEDIRDVQHGKTVSGIRRFKGKVFEVWLSPRFKSNHKRKVDGIMAVLTDVTTLAEAMKTIADREYAMQQELLLAQSIHRMLTPIDLPKLRGFEFGLLLIPSHHIGGDFVNFHELNQKEQLNVTFTDITGHGVGAALLSAMYKVILDDALIRKKPMEETFKAINQSVYEKFPEGFFASTFHARFDAKELTMTYLKAAQDPVYILRNGTVFETITGGAPVLGLLPQEFVGNNSYQKKVFQLERGDIILMFTDGLVEEENDAGEAVGRERLISWVQAYISYPSQELVEKVYQQAKKFVGKAIMEDDVTLLAVRVLDTED